MTGLNWIGWLSVERLDVGTEEGSVPHSKTFL